MVCSSQLLQRIKHAADDGISLHERIAKLAEKGGDAVISKDLHDSRPTRRTKPIASILGTIICTRPSGVSCRSDSKNTG